MGPKTDASPQSSIAGYSSGWFFGLALFLILFFAALLAHAFLNNYQNWGDDWAQYILQGKAILERDVHGFVQQSQFMTRESAVSPGPVAYPWGLPLLLALEGSLFSFTLHVFKIFNIGIFVLLVLCVQRLARRFIGDAGALAAGALFAFNPGLLHYCNYVLTELPFTLLSVCAFLAMEHRHAARRAGAVSRLAAGAFAFAAFTFRTNGILILAAATASEFLPGTGEKENPWRPPAFTTLLLPYVSFSMLYGIWRAIFPAGGEGYSQLLGAVSIHTLAANAVGYPISLFDFFTGGHHSAVLAIFLGPLVLWGACKTWRRTAHWSIYGFLTLALYTVWPEGQGYRFMIPLTPFLVILMMLGLDALAQWKAAGKFGPPIARTVQYRLPILFLLAACALIGTGRLPQEKWQPYDQQSSEMFQWIRSNTPSDAVISFFKPRAMHLLGDRLCLTATPADARKASYLVYAKDQTWNAGQPSLEQYEQAAELMPAFKNRTFVVYRVEAKR